MEFCTAINCIDGRVQIPVIQFLQSRFETEYVDLITEAGPTRFFSGQGNPKMLGSIMSRVDISVQAHDSEEIAVCCHANCAGNPVNDDIQHIQLKQAVNFLKRQFPQCKTIGLWVDENNLVHELY